MNHCGLMAALWIFEAINCFLNLLTRMDSKPKLFLTTIDVFISVFCRDLKELLWKYFPEV